MKLEYYQVDAFTQNVFQGNPAGVCLLPEWIDNEKLQKLAFENGLSETAFVVPQSGYYDIRWFTPQCEVDLCGHATLASAHVLFRHKKVTGNVLNFRSQNEALSVKNSGDTLFLDFPSRNPGPCEVPYDLLLALAPDPVEVLASRDYFVVYSSETIIRNMKPDMTRLARLDKFGVIVTARGDNVDFVSRFFCPGKGIPEDPVTGSAHCTLIPYWSKVLNKSIMMAHQLSARGGVLYCQNLDDRVKIGGRAVTYLESFIEV